MVCLAVVYVVKPGHEEELIQWLGQLTVLTREEPGCRMYQAHRSLSDPRRFFLYEQYDDQAAVDAHRASAHFEEFAKGRIFPILESRTPELYEPLIV